ncbi:MAG: YegS/Rv2252/BmrU family lipid kinase, partial [candidate division WOR-3 bacterium]
KVYLYNNPMIGVIINPYAGNGKGIKKLKYIQDFINEKKLKCKIEITKSKEEGKEKFIEFLEKCERIVLVGGDGTLNNALQLGVDLNIDKTIGMIPVGCGNDFVRGIYERNLPFYEKMEKAFFGKEKYFDAGILESKDKKFVFLNGCGFGIDSMTAKKSEELRVLKGILRYLISLFLVLKDFKPIKVKIKSHDFEYEGEITLITFGNGKYVGGGFKLTPLADPSDGKIDVSIIKKMKKIEILKKLPKAIMGTHINDPYCIYGYFGNPIEIESENYYNFHLDGEIYEIREEKVFIKVKGNFFKFSI